MIEKQEVQEIFPTPLWIVDLQPAAAASPSDLELIRAYFQTPPVGRVGRLVRRSGAGPRDLPR